MTKTGNFIKLFSPVEWETQLGILYMQEIRAEQNFDKWVDGIRLDFHKAFRTDEILDELAEQPDL